MTSGHFELAHRQPMTLTTRDHAFALLKAARPWDVASASRTFKKWAPRPTTRTMPWAARLDAYQFGGADAATASSRFGDFNQRLLSRDPKTRVRAAQDIFDWGRVRPKSDWSDKHVVAVVDAARNPASQARTEPTPWSSSWTKIAAAATHDSDVDRTQTPSPQVIWDSRVSFAIAELSNGIGPIDKAGMLVVPGRTDGRENKSGRAMTLKSEGWRFATGHWSSRSVAFWRSQRAGSLVIKEMVHLLNNHEDFESERREHARWTSFDVALALFVEGY